MVLVILAILAAILVPALLGWIDKAREKQYVLEARNIVLAVQTQASEQYSSADLTTAQGGLDASKIDTKDAADTSDISDLTIYTIGIKADKNSSATKISDCKDSFKVTGIYMTFKSGNDDIVYASLNDGDWKVSTEDDKIEAPSYAKPQGTVIVKAES